MIDPLFKYLKQRSTISQVFYRGEDDGSYKEYARFPIIILPSPPLPSTTLQEALSKRFSALEYTPQSLSLNDIGTLLFWSAGIITDRQLSSGAAARSHPSGGGKYPIEIYPIILKGGDIQKGTYHYNVKKHALERLKYVDVDKALGCFRDTFVSDAGVLLLLSFTKGRSMPKYGGLSYKLGLLEGGHIGQNIYLVSTSLGLGCCGVGDCDTEVLHRLLRLDGANENLFYTLAVGKTTPS